MKTHFQSGRDIMTMSSTSKSGAIPAFSLFSFHFHKRFPLAIGRWRNFENGKRKTHSAVLKASVKL